MPADVVGDETLADVPGAKRLLDLVFESFPVRPRVASEMKRIPMRPKARFWRKKSPYRESMEVPLVMRLPGVLDGGRRYDALTAPVDIMPSLCGLCGFPPPRSVEGLDLSAAWRGNGGGPS